MTVYPWEIDDDRSIIRIDDNLSELGAIVINQIREAIFAMQAEMGITPSGALDSIADRLAVSLNENGTIKSSALTSVGLATLPIHNNQVAANAGIEETKLDLTHSTANLNAAILGLGTTLTSTVAFLQETNSDLMIHITGAQKLTDGSTLARHVASQIDLNKVYPPAPPDSRDPLYTNPGLIDKNGVLRSATTVQGALVQINNALVTHENLTAEAHPATAITVDTSNFVEIPRDATDVQKALDAIDDAETLNIGLHRAVMHDNGVPRTARSELLNVDGYSQNIIPITPCDAFLIQSGSSPVDNNNYGDDVVIFNPEDNSTFDFDKQFAQVRVGDHLRVNYGTGVEAVFEVESLRFEPGNNWLVRINGTNLCSTDGYDGYARIDRKLYDDNTYGVFACAAANHFLPDGTNLDANVLSSITVGHPRAATALGLGFDPNQLDSTHYLLYLHLYPTGNPEDKIIKLEGIDVTGNAGATPGRYTIDSVVHATNNAFRAGGYNHRFLAFNHKGEFGVMLADAINNASFSIINGAVSGGTLTPGSFVNNVIDDVNGSTVTQDALGLGRSKAGLASPEYASYSTADSAANFPNLVIPPLKKRNAIVNGVRLDVFDNTYGTMGDGYWSATITNVNPSIATVETTYTVEQDLSSAGLVPGKTITVQPMLDFDDSLYVDVDYGRFVIKDVVFTAACGPTSASTDIVVMNSVHNTGFPTTSTSEDIQVKLYFYEDTVGFNHSNMVDAVAPSDTFNRYHEIYITDEGNTFSHERVRMTHQGETADLLRTNEGNWTIRSVSPKLRGFRDESATSDFRRWVRFQVVNYNDTTGEYDGRLGRPGTGAGITDYGETVRVRKNTPAKFYDATNVDYIELEFTDSGTGTSDPAGDVMSDNSSDRYVDIEVFSSLALDDEVFMLGGCQHNDTVLTYVGDLREFGTVSEKNLSSSAISFIESGDRYLHANGVLRGLSYQGPDPIDPQTLLFNGGIALVNGHISVMNDGKVRIPEIRETGSTTPVSYDWAVCVNDTGQFLPILVTSSKQEFFAVGTPDYYVPSVTFTELVNSRKDLTPIAIIPVTISSFSTGTVQDIRRRVADETIAIPITVSPPITQPSGSSEEGLLGHFSSLKAALYWVENTKNPGSLIRIRGTVTESSSITISNDVVIEGENDSRLIMDGSLTCSQTVTFRGLRLEMQSGWLRTDTDRTKIIFENCDLEFNSAASGINLNAACDLIASNCTLDFEGDTEINDSGEQFGVTLRDCYIATAGGTWSLRDGSFYRVDSCQIEVTGSDRLFDINGGKLNLSNSQLYWTPDTDSAGDGFLNAGDGLVYVKSNSYDIHITNNWFIGDSSISAGRHPFIYVEVDSSEKVESLYIKDNFFRDDASAANYNAAVVIVGTDNGSSVGFLTNVHINNNTCKEFQGIYITYTDVTDGPGIVGINCRIMNNNCGPICVLTRGWHGNTSFRGDDGNKTPSVLIAGNSATGIGFCDLVGDVVADINLLETGTVVIKDNVTHQIAAAYYSTYEDRDSALIISGNIVEARDMSDMPICFTVDATIGGSGICAYGRNNALTDADYAIITDNVVRGGSSGQRFDAAITSPFHIVTVTGNQIGGFTNYGIAASHSSNNLRGSNIIANNTISRHDENILAYLNAGSGSIVRDNSFDKSTIDGTDTVTIIGGNDVLWTATGNKNFVRTVQFNARLHGTMTQPNFDDGPQILTRLSHATNMTILHVNLDELEFDTEKTGSTPYGHLSWEVPLTQLLPPGVRIVSCSIAYEQTDGDTGTTADWAGGDMNLSVRLVSDDSLSGASGSADLASANSGTMEAVPVAVNTEPKYARLFADLRAQSGFTVPPAIKLYPLVVTYWQ